MDASVRKGVRAISRVLGLAPRPPIRVTLYSKKDCPLCNEAEAAVTRVFGRGNVNVVDILSDRRLEDAYVFRIPVLAIGDEVLAEGRIEIADARDARRRAARRLEELKDS